jgi:hypothetical protein
MRPAGALNIKTHQLFTVPVSPEEAMEQLRRDILSEIKQTVGEVCRRSRERSLCGQL